MAGSSKKEVEERQRLHTLVQLQAQEVEALKAEIAILSRKGGLYLEFKKCRFIYIFWLSKFDQIGTYRSKCQILL